MNKKFAPKNIDKLRTIGTPNMLNSITLKKLTTIHTKILLLIKAISKRELVDSKYIYTFSASELLRILGYKESINWIIQNFYEIQSNPLLIIEDDRYRILFLINEIIVSKSTPTTITIIFNENYTEHLATHLQISAPIETIDKLINEPNEYAFWIALNCLTQKEISNKLKNNTLKEILKRIYFKDIDRRKYHTIKERILEKASIDYFKSLNIKIDTTDPLNPSFFYFQPHNHNELNYNVWIDNPKLKHANEFLNKKQQELENQKAKIEDMLTEARKKVKDPNNIKEIVEALTPQETFELLNNTDKLKQLEIDKQDLEQTQSLIKQGRYDKLSGVFKPPANPQPTITLKEFLGDKSQ